MFEKLIKLKDAVKNQDWFCVVFCVAELLLELRPLVHPVHENVSLAEYDLDALLVKLEKDLVPQDGVHLSPVTLQILLLILEKALEKLLK